MTLRPRRNLHRGVVPASALHFDPGLLGANEARGRIVAAWEPGAGIAELPGGRGLLLRLPHPRLLDCTVSPGLPLVARGRWLLAAPLEDDEIAALAPAPDDVVLVRSGRAVRIPWQDTREIDPAGWIDSSHFSVEVGATLGALPAPPASSFEELRTPLRDRLLAKEEVQSKASARLERAAAALQGAGTARTRIPGGMTPGKSALAAFATRALRLVSALLPAGRVEPNGEPARRGRADRSGLQGPPASRGAAARFWSAVARLAARIANQTALSMLVQRRTSRYVAQLVDMFRQGKLEEALHHAIALNPPGSPHQAPSLGSLQPREDLSISGASFGTGKNIALSPDIRDALRRHYQQAHDRLLQQGREEAAAFVLAELLGDAEAAVSLLERSGRLRAAAEIAEARQVNPGIVVRQWILAGEHERAFWIARRSGAFAVAVDRLQRTHPEEARTLRRSWAESLAAGGDYAGATQAIWPEEPDRPLAASWIDRGIELGGASGLRLCVYKVALREDSFAEVRDRVVPHLEEETQEGAAAREAFARQLLAHDQTPALAALARVAARTLLRDRAAGRSLVQRHVFEKLVKFAGDPLLRADLPALASNPANPQPGDKLACTIADTDGGTRPVLDAALLPSGKLVVALGEAGVWVLSDQGRRVRTFDVPAHGLVVSDSGAVAIAVASRGGMRRLTRLELDTGTHRRWCDARVDTYARSFDGSTWFVGIGDSIHAIDCLAPDLRSIWRVGDIGGRVAAIVRAQRCFSAIVNGSEEPEGWTWDMAGPALRRRNEISVPEDGYVALSSAGTVVEFVPVGGDFRATIATEHQTRRLAVPGDDRELLEPIVGERWLALPSIGAAGMRIDFSSLVAEHRGAIELEGTCGVSIRLGEIGAVIADDRGRLLVVDLQAGLLRCDLRV